MTCEITIEQAAEHFPSIPERTLQGIYRHVEHGTPTGSFLYAVLSNDLMRAVGTADTENRAALLEITALVYNYVPSAAWGSPEKVEAWRAAFLKKAAQNERS